MEDQRKVQKAFAETIVSPIYLADLKRRAEEGSLAPGLELRLWDYLYGKPAEHVQIDIKHQHSLEGKSLAELSARAQELSRILDGLASQKQLAEGTIDAEVVSEVSEETRGSEAQSADATASGDDSGRRFAINT